MRLLRCALLAAALLCPGRAAAQDDGFRVLPAAAGGVLGIMGGGYVALSIIVAEARAGKYIHDFDDVFGWRSLPAIAGASLGTGLGIYSPERLRRAVIMGFAGFGGGAMAGYVIGRLVWREPEGRWAGAAIGAGAGLAIGYVLGALTASGDDDITGSSGTSAPVLIRISVP
ncbi:MAG TPA: glycine zipper 2TM domain-containing protein [Longimicrobiales bacterium]|nr:glycine zipper 2TM domain-containing protein [Longimicrobiales bacterium]